LKESTGVSSLFNVNSPGFPDAWIRENRRDAPKQRRGTGTCVIVETAMPGIDFDVLRAEITMGEVLDKLGFQPASRSGDQWHGPCPVHRSTHPRSRTFSVNLASGRYYCHKCHSHGNPLDLWAAVHKMSLYEAAVNLCGALDREVPWIERW
jgi:hypothetical protein